MEAHRFDAFAKLLVTRRSRKDLLRALVGAALGGLVGRGLVTVPDAEAGTPVGVAFGADARVAVGANECAMTGTASQLKISFGSSVRGLTLTGTGQVSARGIDHTLSMTVRRAGAVLFRFNAILSIEGIYSATWRYGTMVRGIRTARLSTQDGKHISGTVNGRKLLTVTRSKRPLRFADGAQVPQAIFPAGALADLSRLETATRRVLSSCQANTGLGIAVSNRDTQTYGSPGQVEDTSRLGSCVGCVAEAYRAEALCAGICAGSFGLACTCVGRLPAIFAQCHHPGTGLGQGCCPVGCGPLHHAFGIGVDYRCCNSSDACLDSSTSTCCSSGLQPCNQSLCCPSDAPCRDVGICCPTNRHTCKTPAGVVCCKAGEHCAYDWSGPNQCCPVGSASCGGRCCENASECAADGYCPGPGPRPIPAL
jgi:hypothetical protein